MWLKLLENWSLEEKRTGLTIPYIVGALNKNERKLNSVNDLFELIFNSNIETTIYLNYCDEFLGEYVLTTHKFINIHHTETKGKTSISFSQSCEILGKNYSQILEKLSSRYNQHIEKSNYSKNGKNWGDFTEKETQFIQKNS